MVLLIYWKLIATFVLSSPIQNEETKGTICLFANKGQGTSINQWFRICIIGQYQFYNNNNNNNNNNNGNLFRWYFESLIDLPLNFVLDTVNNKSNECTIQAVSLIPVSLSAETKLNIESKVVLIKKQTILHILLEFEDLCKISYLLFAFFVIINYYICTSNSIHKLYISHPFEVWFLQYLKVTP